MANEKIFLSMGIFFIFIIIAGMAATELYTGGDVTFSLAGADIDTENLPSGMQILNIGKASFISNSADVNGEAFVMNVVQNNMGDSAAGTIVGSQFETSDNRVAENSLTITSEITDYRCIYDITTDVEFLYKYSAVYSCNTDNLGREDSCGSLFNPITQEGLNARCSTIAEQHNSDWYYSTLSDEGFFKIDKAYCVIRTKETTSGKLSAPDFSMSSIFNVNIGGTNYPLKLGLDSDTGAMVNSAVTPMKEVKIYYTGNLVNMGTQSCPQIETNLKWKAVRVADDWRIVPKSAYDSQISNHELKIESCLDKGTVWGEIFIKISPYTDIQTCMNEVNDNTDAVVKSITIPTDEARMNDINVDSAQLSYFPNTMTQFPTYQLIVKASTLDLVRNVGEPRIDTIQIYDIKAGTDRNMNVIVTNIGSATSSFHVSATCNNGISSPETITTSAILPNSNSMAVLKLTAPANILTSKLLSQCTITAIDSTDPSIKDTKTVSFNVVQDTICTKDQIRCDGLKAEICTGISWELSPNNDVMCEQAKVCDDTKPDTKCESQILFECDNNAWIPNYASLDCQETPDCLY